MMGINSAADKWKWVAIHIMDSILPKSQVLLDRMNNAVEAAAVPLLVGNMNEATVATTKLVKNMDGAVALMMFAFVIMMPVFFVAFVIPMIRRGRRQADYEYVCRRYGSTLDARVKTYVYLMRFYIERVRAKGFGKDTKKTCVVFIGVDDIVDVYLRCEPHGYIDFLPPNNIPCTFETINDAFRSLNEYCTAELNSKPPLPKTLFILLLISSRDPLRGPHNHEEFHVPERLKDHQYAIIGIGGDKGVLAHRLSAKSTGPTGDLLVKSLPLGREDAKVYF